MTLKIIDPYRRGLLAAVTLLFASLLGIPAAEAQFKVSSSVDRNTLVLGETVNLKVVVSGEQRLNSNIDLKFLERDFHVTPAGNRSEQRIANGKRNFKQVWNFILQPKRQGRFIIPAFEIGGSRSAQIQLTVNAAPTQSTAPGSKPPIFVEATVDKTTVPVRSQVLYTMKVAYSVNIRGNVVEPKFNDNTPFFKLKESRYRKRIGNRQYNISEWRYALFPQKSGQFKIPAARLDARFNRSIKKYSSEVITLEVLPIPAELAGESWLPAKELELREEWDNPPDQPLIIGQPLTREIKIVVNGLLAEQLPELKIDDIAGVKIYPEQANLKNKKRADGLHSVRRETIVMIPTRLGNIELPPVQVSWWNTEEGGLETAVLPGRTIEVVADSEPQLTLDGEPDDSIVTPAGQVSANTLLGNAAEAQQGSGGALPGYFLLLVIAGFGAWPLLLGLWWRQRSRLLAIERKQSADDKLFADTIAGARQQIIAACQRNDAAAAQLALMRWGQLCWPVNPPVSLTELAQRSGSKSLRTAVDNLNRRVYRDHIKQWNGALLADAIEGIKDESILEKARRWWLQKNRLPALAGSE